MANIRSLFMVLYIKNKMIFYQNYMRIKIRQEDVSNNHGRQT